MKIFKNKKHQVYFWTLWFIIIPTIVGYLFKGPKIFSSVSYYFIQTSIGYAYGIVFGIGYFVIDKYFEKLDSAKNPKRTNRITFMVFMGYAIFTGIMAPYLVDRFLWGMSGISIFYDVSAKAFITTVLSLIVFYFNITTLISNNWIKSIEKNEELKRENLLAKYEALKNQVNPHFLFNNLNTLSGIVEQKPELATEFIKKLSDIYRYVLEQSDKELVSIYDEMKFVEDYIFLSKMRFGEALLFNSVLPAKSNAHVASLGLQMLVENAIKHNIISDDMPLKIEIGIEDGFVILKNNIQEKPPLFRQKPQGLENLKKRYEYLTDAPLEIVKSEKVFIVKLPIIEPEKI